MSKRIAWLMIVVLSWTGAALADAPGATASDPGELDAWLAQQQASGQIAAAAVALIDGDRVQIHGVGHRAGGKGSAPGGDSQFQIGSVTKVFTHLLLAEMVQTGEVRYDTPIARVLPDSVVPRNAAVGAITLQALATHHSGLPRLPANLDLSNSIDPYADYDSTALYEGIVDARDRQPLGAFYTYSNFGVGLLGHVLGRVDGAGYRDAVMQRVITPLRLQHTGFEPGQDAVRPVSGGTAVTAWTFDDALAGAGALWGSVSDLARLVQAYFGSHEHALQHALSADLADSVAASGFEVTRVWHVARSGKTPVYWHNGGTAGFHSFVGFRLDTRKGIAILASGGADPTAIGLKMLGAAPLQPTPGRIDGSVFGQYPISPQFGIGVFESEGVLVAQATGQPSFELHAIGNDWYALGEIDASLHFLRDDGNVTGLELAQGGAITPAPRATQVATAAARTAIKLDADALSAYVGEYAFAPGVALTVKQGAETLEARLGGQPFFPIFPRAADRFFYKVVDAELQFERDASGHVKAVVLHQNGVEQRARRDD